LSVQSLQSAYPVRKNEGASQEGGKKRTKTFKGFLLVEDLWTAYSPGKKHRGRRGSIVRGIKFRRGVRKGLLRGGMSYNKGTVFEEVLILSWTPDSIFA